MYLHLCMGCTHICVCHTEGRIYIFLENKTYDLLWEDQTLPGSWTPPLLQVQRAWSWWMACMTMWRHLGLDLPTSRGPASQADAYQVFSPLPFIMLPLLPIAVGVFPRALVQGRWNVLNMVASALSRCDNSILLSISWFKKLWWCLGRWLSQ